MNVYPQNPNEKDLDLDSPSTYHTMSPAQFSLSLDHVLEMILRSLNLAQLFECRLLSRQWNSIASVFIQKRVEIIFYERHPSTRTLDKSKNILQKKITQLDSLPIDPRSHFPFPVNNFTFYFLDIFNSRVSRFLNIHGPNIKELTLQSCVGRTEAQLMDFVATLLSKQTRNLEILTLCVRATDIQWKTRIMDDEDYEDENCCVDVDHSASLMFPEEPEFFEIYSRFQYENPHSNLRVFEIDSEISAKIFEVVCRMSPKLEEIIIHSYYAGFLVTPVNRAHVLKTFCSSWWKRCFRDDVILEFLTLLNVKNRLKLKTIVLRYADVYQSYEIEKSWNNLVDVINYIFKISCDSIESLSWINLSFLKDEGIVWCPMRNLRKLTIGCYYNAPFSWPTRPKQIFPMGFSAVKTFPQLETVQLCIHTESHRPRGNLTDILLSLNFERTESVRLFDIRDESPRAIITAEHVRIIKNLFPLARIVTGRTCARYPFFCRPSNC